MIKITYNFKDTINLATEYYYSKENKYGHKERFEKIFPELKNLKNKNQIRRYFERKYKEIEQNHPFIKERIKSIKTHLKLNIKFLEKNLFSLMEYNPFDVNIGIILLFFAPYSENGFYLPIFNDNYLNDADYLYLHETSHIIWHKREKEIIKKLRIDKEKYFRALHDIKELFASVIINQEIFKDIVKTRLKFIKRFRDQDFNKDYGNYYENYFLNINGQIINIVDYFMEFYNKNKKQGFLYIQEEAIKQIIKINEELEDKFKLIKELQSNKKIIQELKEPIIF